jgi:hypothetical protein
MVGRGEVRRDLAGLMAAKSDETATVGQGGCYRRIRVRLGPTGEPDTNRV